MTLPPRPPVTPPATPNLGIFYSVFDDQVGPQIRSQVPAGTISEPLFEQISTQVFCNRELVGSIITITTQGKQVMSCSFSLEGAHYQRHRFSFAVSMVFAEDDDTGPYQPVLHKMAKTLHALERDSRFLSSQQDNKIGLILERVLDDLVLRGESQVNLGNTTLALKLFPKLLEPPPVSDYKVPILVRDLRSLMTRDWDLAIQRIEPFIDGRNFVKRIAQLSGLDLSLTRQCIGQLLYYRAVAIVDVFQYGNFYACTSGIGRLLTDVDLEKECLRAVCTSASPPRPVIHRIVHLYASLHPSAPFGDFCIEHDTERHNLDDLALVSFGLRYDFIRRVHSIPVFCNRAAQAKSSEGPGDNQVKRLIDGHRNFDEICGETTMSAAEVAISCAGLGSDVVIVRR